MQGELIGKRLEARIESRCACCERPIHLETTSDLEAVRVEGDRPVLLFTPEVDWDHLSAPTIIPDY